LGKGKSRCHLVQSLQCPSPLRHLRSSYNAQGMSACEKTLQGWRPLQETHVHELKLQTLSSPRKASSLFTLNSSYVRTALLLYKIMEYRCKSVCKMGNMHTRCEETAIKDTIADPTKGTCRYSAGGALPGTVRQLASSIQSGYMPCLASIR